jgi:hypothetical protein
MKKILSLLTVAVVVLAFGLAYADDITPMAKDSFLNYIDPSTVDPAIAEAAIGHGDAEAVGEAAGGFRSEGDTLLNYIDPSRMDAVVGGPVSGMIDSARDEDTFLKYIDPGKNDWE